MRKTVYVEIPEHYVKDMAKAWENLPTADKNRIMDDNHELYWHAARLAAYYKLNDAPKPIRKSGRAKRGSLKYLGAL